MSGWSEPKDLRELSEDVHGIEARLSPDNKTLYYSNMRNPGTGKDLPGNLYIWMTDISSYVKELP